MFQEAYKRAYNQKVPKQDLVQEIEEKLNRRSNVGRLGAVLRPVAAVLAILFAGSITVVPIMAKELPILYRIIESYAPNLAEYVLPEAYYSEKAGIIMQVEAIQVNEKEAEVLLSFTDAEGFDHIHGKIDLYDSYVLTSYSGVSNVGGSSFLEYDEAEDKAYYKLSMSTWEQFDTGRFRLQVRQILTDCPQECVEVDLSNVDRTPVFQTVTLSGGGGTISDKAAVPSVLLQSLGGSEEESWRRGAQVMVGSYDSTFADKLEITAIGYQDGMLRVQNCRGNLENADRHMQLMLVDKEGTERHCDYSVDWHMEAAGERMAFNEQWFLISEEELSQMQMIAYRYISDGSVKGNWEVVFTAGDVMSAENK